MFEDSRSGFSAASENQWGEKVQWMFWMISTLWLAWEDADLDKELRSATAGACPRVLR